MYQLQRGFGVRIGKQAREVAGEGANILQLGGRQRVEIHKGIKWNAHTTSLGMNTKRALARREE